MNRVLWLCAVCVVGVAGCGGAPETIADGAAAPGAATVPAGGGAPGAARSRPTAPARPAAPAEVVLPAGTELAIALGTALSTETATAGDAVTGTLTRAVSVDGRVVVPAGAVVSGSVAEVDRAGRVKGKARVALSFTSVTVAGTRHAIATQPVVREGEATKSEDATKVGIGAGAGAAIGAILGGRKGAAQGAAVGAAGGTGVVLATRGRALELATGEPLTVTLTAPVKVRAGS